MDHSSDLAAVAGAWVPQSEHLVFEYMDCLLLNEETGFFFFNALKTIVI